jgi:hypothetical protein
LRFGVVSGQFAFKLENVGTEICKGWEVGLSSREECKFLIGFQSSKAT